MPYTRTTCSASSAGGVTRTTYDAMHLCEAAGYDVIVVETVGVGQSEVSASDLVDLMMLVMPPVGGDGLQVGGCQVPHFLCCSAHATCHTRMPPVTH